MSCFAGPGIIDDGLVFYYDSSNTDKSWKGPPATNLAKVNESTKDWTIGNLTAAVALSTVTSDEVFRITSTTGGGFRIYFNLSKLVNASTYTLSLKYRFISGTSPSFSLTDWCDASITSTTTLLQDGSTYHTATGTRATYDATYRFMDATISANTVVEIWDVQLEQNTFATPYTKFQRTNTQALVDLTNNNTVTATSLTYASDNTFSFNGSSNYIISSNAGLSHGTGGFSYSCWAKWNSLPSLGTLFENGLYTAGILIRFETNVIHVYSEYTATSYNVTMSFVPTIGAWYNLVLVRSGNTLYLYSNGEQISSPAFGTSINVQPSTGFLYIGRSQHTPSQYFNGSIGNVKIYNRALSDSEVKQNFNALRSRYGL